MNPSYAPALDILNARKEATKQRREKSAAIMDNSKITVTLNRYQIKTLCRLLNDAICEAQEDEYQFSLDPAPIDPATMAFYLETSEDQREQFSAIRSRLETAAGIKWPY